MKHQDLFLDFIIPGAVLLFSGVVTFALTGGPEEYPSLQDQVVYFLNKYQIFLPKLY